MGVRSPSYVFFTGGTFMNESEARRRELLRQTRRLYHETGRSTPVIHPRYGNLTTSVTEDDAAEDHSFLFRLDYGKIEVAEVNSGRILNGIEKQITPKEMKEELIQVWKAL